MATWYVATNGSNNNSGTSRSAAFRTIQYACTQNQLQPGDEIRILPGLYTENVSISAGNTKSGTSGNLITVTADDTSDLPKIRGSDPVEQWRMRDLSYWTIDRLQFDNYRAGGGLHVISDAIDVTRVTVQNCRFINQKAPTGGKRLHVLLAITDTYGRKMTQVRFLDNYLLKCSPVAADREAGNECITFIGNVQNSMIAGNELDQCYAIGINLAGNHDKGQPANNIVRNNNVEIFLEDYWTKRGHGGGIYNDRALSGNVIEGNYVYTGSGPTCLSIDFEEAVSNRMSNTRGVIVRNNVFVSANNNVVKFGQGGFANNSSLDYKWLVERPVFAHNVVITTYAGTIGQAVILARSKWLRMMNNIILHRGANHGQLINPTPWPTTAEVATWSANGNLYYDSASAARWRWAPGGTNYTTLAAYQSGTSQDADGQYANPTFTDEATQDYTLDTGSNGEGDGAPLTYANGAGSSSTTLAVNDGWFFSDGNGLSGGDTIYIGTPGSGSERVIASVDQASGTIELTSAATWSDNAEIHYKYNGSAPSVGLTSTVSTVGTGDGIDDTEDGVDSPDTGTDDNVRDVVANYGFDTELLPWQKYTAGTATITVASAKLNATVSSTGGNTQVFQSGLAIQEGVTYTLTVSHQSSASSYNVTFAVQEHLSPYTNLGLNETVTVTTDASTTQVQFVATESSSNARLRIQLPATSTNTLYFDTVRLTYPATTGGSGSGGSSGTQTVTIAAGTDDGYYRPTVAGFWTNTANTLWIGKQSTDGFERATWLRFTLDSAIPDGATIDEAYLDLYIDQTPSGSGWSTVITVRDTADAGVPPDQATIDAYTWITGPTWEPASLTMGTRYHTDDMATALQTLIDNQGGLAAGASVLVRLRDSGAVAANRGYNVESYEGASAAGDTSRRANLYLAWTIPQSGTDRTFGETFSETFGETWGAL